jgi:hypothetical protein
LSSSDASTDLTVNESARTIKGLEEVKTLERIESLEEAAMKLGSQTSQTNFEHEEEKSRILGSLRVKKEEIIQNAISIKDQ